MKPDEPYPQTVGQNKRFLPRLPLSVAVAAMREATNALSLFLQISQTHKRKVGAGELAHCVRTLAAKQEDLNSSG